MILTVRILPSGSADHPERVSTSAVARSDDGRCGGGLCSKGVAMAGSVERRSTEPSTTAKMSVPTLTAMVVGGMVGAGVFSLPARFGVATGILGSLIAWAIAGTGMLMLAFVFQNLAHPQARAGLRRLHLRQGRLRRLRRASTPRSGSGPARSPATPSTGCSSAPRSARSSTASATATPCWRVALSTAGVWLFHYLIARGVRDAAVINRIVTIFKILPILVFIVVLFFYFDAGVFADNWTAYGYGDLGRPQRAGPQHHDHHDVRVHRHRGRQRLLPLRPASARTSAGRPCSGFLSVLSIFALVTLSSYSVVPQPELAATRQPSMVGVFESRRRRLGRGVHQRRGHRLRPRRLPRLDADGCRGHVHPGPRTTTSRRSSARRTPHGTPITALVVTSLARPGAARAHAVRQRRAELHARPVPPAWPCCPTSSPRRTPSSSASRASPTRASSPGCGARRRSSRAPPRRTRCSSSTRPA